jgi:hypothetical protein
MRFAGGKFILKLNMQKMQAFFRFFTGLLASAQKHWHQALQGEPEQTPFIIRIKQRQVAKGQGSFQKQP